MKECENMRNLAMARDAIQRYLRVAVVNLPARASTFSFCRGHVCVCVVKASPGVCWLSLSIGWSGSWSLESLRCSLPWLGRVLACWSELVCRCRGESRPLLWWLFVRVPFGCCVSVSSPRHWCVVTRSEMSDCVILWCNALLVIRTVNRPQLQGCYWFLHSVRSLWVGLLRKLTSEFH